MEERKARAMLQVWAGDDDGVKEYKPRSTRIEPKPQHRVRGKTSLAEMVNDFIRRNLIAILVLTAFALEGWIVAVYTEHKVSREVRQTVEAEMRQGFAEYLEAQEEERKRASLLVDDESINNAIMELGRRLKIHCSCLRMDRKVNKAGAETYLWVDVARLASGKYGDNIDAVLESGQIEAYDKNHATRDEDGDIAYDVAERFIRGEWPDGYTTDLQFAEINADGSVTARTKLYTDSTTKFWRIEES